MPSANLCRRLLSDNRGNSLVVFAAALPALLGAGGFAIDAISLVVAKRELQRKADTAALAGAHAVAQKKQAAGAAEKAMTLSRQLSFPYQKAINNAPTSGAFVGNATAVEAVLVGSPEVHFMSLFTSRPFRVTARAVAARIGSSPACIIALDPTAKYGIEMTGNAKMDLQCSMASNSNHNTSVRLTGNLALNNVGEVSAVGGIEVSGNAKVPGAQRLPYSHAVEDPHKDLSPPASPSGCTYTNLKLDKGTHVLAPGRYCGYLEIVGDAKVTFSPGTHVIAGEFFKINGGPASSVTGDGVSFILTSRNGKWANLDWNGDTTVSLSAPKTTSNSPYAGVLVMQDRNAPSSTKNYINGNLKLSLRGSLYFPNQWFEWNGNVLTQSDCLRLVARQMYLNGNIGLANKCTAEDATLAAARVRRVRLVE